MLFEELLALLERGHVLTARRRPQTIDLVKGDDVRPTEVLGDRVLTSRGRSIGPKTLGQKKYVDALRRSTVTFAIGPAGTGKTYLAVATAVKALQDSEVRRIILTRPAVEAGERLGFLPGTLYEKIDPYMKPLYDALYEMMDADALQRLMERGTIEVAPLAFMRGRTLNDSFIILDEGQNTSPEQMKMFLTRLGFGSKAAINGDVTQTDLPAGQRSGLSVIEDILAGIEGIEFIHMGARDVVRHKIVQDIVEAYRRFSERPASDRRVTAAVSADGGRPTDDPREFVDGSATVLVSNRQDVPVDADALAGLAIDGPPRRGRGGVRAVGVVRRSRRDVRPARDLSRRTRPDRRAVVPAGRRRGRRHAGAGRRRDLPGVRRVEQRRPRRRAPPADRARRAPPARPRPRGRGRAGRDVVAAGALQRGQRRPGRRRARGRR